jgi:hypothetical protein
MVVVVVLKMAVAVVAVANKATKGSRVPWPQQLKSPTLSHPTIPAGKDLRGPVELKKARVLGVLLVRKLSSLTPIW